MIAEHGLEVLLAAPFLAGLVVIAIGLLRLGKAKELMPHSVIVGFTAGIGVLILFGQMPGSGSRPRGMTSFNNSPTQPPTCATAAHGNWRS